MRIKKINNTAFTLLEVLLAAIIFVISVGGVFITLDAMRKPVADKESELNAALFGKQVLEALRSQVNVSSYYGCCSTNPTCSYPLPTCPDFSLAFGLHQVPEATMQSTVAISWPSALGGSNPIPGCDPNNNCLVYNVSCGDGSIPSGNPPLCGNNPDIAREVQVNIEWNGAS